MDAKAILKQMTLAEKTAFCSGRDFWHTKSMERLGVGSAMMCDGPHGLRKQEGEGDHLGLNESIETVCYPTAATMASSFDREAMAKLGDALGRECQAEDVDMLLGPGLNVKRSPLCGRNFEYFSEDPYLAGQMGASYVKALQAQGVAACAKHFACNNQETLRMTGDSEVDERTLREIYLPAFEAVVKEGGTRGVMCAYNAVNGEFCAQNKKLLTDILRDEWGYGGIVVTDWGAIKDRAKGVAAGLDLEMPGGPAADGSAILKAVEAGALSEAELDRAVLRLLDFAQTAAENRKSGATIDREACRRLSRELAGECAVLMKNEDVLPLKENRKVAFIGEFAQMPRYQGAGSSHIIVPHAVGAMECANGDVLFARGYDSRATEANPALVEEALQVATDADTVVIYAGLPDAWETEGVDRDHMKHPENQNALISAVAKANPNTVVVLHTGAPVELPWLNEVKGLLCVYLGGEQVGAATADLLYGRVNPSGHLAETWPIKLADNPAHLNFPGEEGVVHYAEDVFVGYRYYDKKEMPVNYPFGHGLSYTRFEFSNLRLDRDSMKDTDTLRVTVDVANIGDRFGKCVAQLYVRDEKSTVRRPIRELKGFDKLALGPGEKRTATFELDKRAFAYYEPKCGDWFVESGNFIIEVGESSRDLPISAKVFVEGTKKLSFTVTDTTTIGQLMKHPKGAALVSKLVPASPDGDGGMGEGSDRMMQNMLVEMPLSYIDGGIAREDEALAEKCRRLVEALPDVNTLIHGDFHTGNVFMQKGEPLLIYE